MPEEQKKVRKYTIFPGIETINNMPIAELVQLKILLEKYELFLARKIRSIIQT